MAYSIRQVTLMSEQFLLLILEVHLQPTYTYIPLLCIADILQKYQVVLNNTLLPVYEQIWKQVHSI